MFIDLYFPITLLSKADFIYITNGYTGRAVL